MYFLILIYLVLFNPTYNNLKIGFGPISALKSASKARRTKRGSLKRLLKSKHNVLHEALQRRAFLAPCMSHVC